MTSAEESKYIILPAAAVVIIASLMTGIGSTASKAVEQSSPQQPVSTAAVITPVSSVQQPVREESKKVVETPVQVQPAVGSKSSEPRANDNTKEIQLAKQAKESIAEQLKDPDSARFKKIFVTQDGAVVGYLNAKNGYGAYGGFEPFVWKTTDRDVVGVMKANGDMEDLLRSQAKGTWLAKEMADIDQAINTRSYKGSPVIYIEDI